MISVRIVLTDHYLTSVNPPFDPVDSKLRHPIRQVPIIRIFGPNEQGTRSSSSLTTTVDFVDLRREEGVPSSAWCFPVPPCEIAHGRESLR